MGGRVAANEDSREVFLRGCISGYRGGSYSAPQELDPPSLLPGSDVRRDPQLQRYGKRFEYRILSGLFRDGLRSSCEEIRPLGR
jgi:hypothetical protein